MAITITRFVTFENEGALKAFCDVSVANLVLIKGIRVVIGKNGPFISMPRQQSKNGKWYDSVVPLSPDVKQQLHRVVLETFHTKVKTAQAPTDSSTCERGGIE